MHENQHSIDIEIWTEDEGLRQITIPAGRSARVSLRFGPHYFATIGAERPPDAPHASATGLAFYVGATHHGIWADASTVGGELEQFVNSLAEQHPDRAF